jgi:hypothetical protein
MIAQHGQRGDTKIEHKIKGVSGLEVFRDAKLNSSRLGLE